jgi:hypothetical protein
MWNKLFKRKKSKSSNEKHDEKRSEENIGEKRHRRTPACFSFGKHSNRDHKDFYKKGKMNCKKS